MKQLNATQKKTLVVINDMGISKGGTQKRIYQLIQELLRKNVFDKIIVIAHTCAIPLTEKVEKNITCIYTNKKSVKSLLVRILHENAIDIVQVHNLSLLSTIPIQIAKKMRKKVIFFAHDYWPICGRRSFYTATQGVCSGPGCIKCNTCIGLLSYIHLNYKIQSCLNQCDMGIATSKYMIQQYESAGILQGKWKQIIPWIEKKYLDISKKISPIPRKKSKKKILYVGTLDREKGFFDLLESFIPLCKEKKDIVLVAIGDASQENKNKIEAILQKENITDNVVCVGFVKNTPELITYYQQADLFIFPSLLNESFGQTWAQALALGIPIVAYDSGAVHEFLQEYATLVSVGDKDALKHAISSFFYDSDVYDHAMIQAEKGKKYAKIQFSLKNSFPSIKKIYLNYRC